LQDRSDNLEFTQLTGVRRLLHPAKFLVEPEFIESHQVLKPSSRLDGAPNAFENVSKLVDGLVLRPVIRGLVTPRRICVGEGLGSGVCNPVMIIIEIAIKTIGLARQREYDLTGRVRHREAGHERFLAS